VTLEYVSQQRKQDEENPDQNLRAVAVGFLVQLLVCALKTTDLHFHDFSVLLGLVYTTFRRLHSDSDGRLSIAVPHILLEPIKVTPVLCCPKIL